MRYGFMDDSYRKEFKTKTLSIKERYVILEDNLFYPTGGGQPHDTGKIIDSKGEEFNVISVAKFGGGISHEVDREGLKEGEEVNCVIDWERRYSLMKAHTSSHLLNSVLEKKFGAKITGNHLGIDKNRMDFNLEDYDVERMKEAIDECNTLIRSDLPITISYMASEEAKKDSSLVKLANSMPPDVEELRIVEIKGQDRQADGGTHVKSLKEIGRMEFIKSENKGKNNRRVYWKII